MSKLPIYEEQHLRSDPPTIQINEQINDMSFERSRGSSILAGGSADPKKFEDSGKTTVPGAIFIVVNVALGAGMLNMPGAFGKAGGVAASLIVEACIVGFVAAALVILAKCAEKHGASVYQEIVRSMAGKYFELLTEIIIVIFLFYACISLQILTGDQSENIIKLIISHEAYNKHHMLFRQIAIAVITVCIIFPICLPRDISFLQIPGLVSVLSIFYVALAVIVQYFVLDIPVKVIQKSPSNVFQVLNCIPTFLMGYQCHVSAMPVYAGLKERTMKNWTIVSVVSIGLCSLAYATVGMTGYLTFGNAVDSDVLDSYKSTNVSIIIARIALATAVTMTYPAVHFAGRAALESLYRKAFRLSEIDGKRTWTIRYYIQTILWVAGTLIVALLVPNFGSVVQPIGALAAIFILGLPGVCLIRLSEQEGYSGAKYYICNVFGCIYIISCTFIFGQNFFAGFT